VCATTVPETGLGTLFRHELRWARTIRALVPMEFAASAIQYPLAWAALALALSGGAAWATLGCVLAWAWRGAAARALDARLGLVQSGLATPAPLWLLPLRDMLGLLEFAASYCGDRVEWRGQVLHTALDKSEHDATSTDAASQGAATYATFGRPSR
jgi:ceramide glucosyltransferase